MKPLSLTSCIARPETDVNSLGGATIPAKRSLLLPRSRWAVMCIMASLSVFCVGTALAQRVVALASGYYHHAVLREDGTVWTWGDNHEAQLGDGGKLNKAIPIPVHGLMSVSKIAAGGFHTLALRSDGTVWTWGRNDEGQLGDGTTFRRRNPKQIAGLDNVVAIAAGGYHSFAVKADGSVWAWGYNEFGELGDGSFSSKSTPVRVSGLATVVMLAAGVHHSLALNSDGSVWAWGRNDSGQLGTGGFGNIAVPTVVSGISSVTSIAAGWYHSLARRSDARVQAWGANESGQLGDGTVVNRNAPIPVPGLDNVTEISANGQYSVARSSAGGLRSWGRNNFGQLGDGTTQDRSSPVAVLGLADAAALAAGSHSMLTGKSDGSIWVWGNNDFGQLADGTVIDQPTPRYVATPGPTRWVAAGGFHTLLRSTDGTTWASGANYYGQLGDGTTQRRDEWVRAPSLDGATVLVAGRYHNLALRSDGRVLAFGYNAFGQIGEGTNVDRPTPVLVTGLSSVVALATGGGHSLALRADGSVWAWGQNSSGQLGEGSTANRSTPTQVPGLSGVVAIAAGEAHSYALKADGTVWAWGGNVYGQLGDGTRVSRSNPGPVSGLVGVSQIASGWFHGLALQSIDSVLAWGSNEFGQIGDGTTQDALLPTPALGIGTATALAAGGYYSVALHGDGTMHAWGRAPASGSSADRTSAARLAFVRNTQSISAGGWHVVASDPSGRVFTWGNGQLGLPSAKSTSVPQRAMDPVDPSAARNASVAAEFINNQIGGGHYFITASYGEALAIDTGAAGPGWSRTGHSWRAWTSANTVPVGVAAVPVYRFYAAGPNSHFFTLSTLERDNLLSLNPTNDPQKGWALEGTGFYSYPAVLAASNVPLEYRDQFGNTCPESFYPVFRAYNNRFAFNDSNHRITSHFVDILRGVRFFGWSDEGIKFCAPTSSVRGGDLQAYYTFPGDQVAAGTSLESEHFFSNSGPGDASGATMHMALPQELSWQVACTAIHGAECPTPAQLAAVDDLAIGVAIPKLPAGGVLKLVARTTAPTTPRQLSFASAIAPPSGAPDPWMPDNTSNVSTTVVLSPGQCAATLSTAHLGIAAAGTSAGAEAMQVTIAAPQNCNWSITANQAWVQLVPNTGNGTRAIKVYVEANLLNVSRTAVLTATAMSTSATAQAVLAQSGKVSPTMTRCEQVRLERAADNVGANIVQGQFAVFADSCLWEAAASEGWLTLRESAAQVGEGTIRYQVQANLDATERKASILIGGQRFDIVQAGQATLSTEGPGGDGGGGGDGGE